MEGRQVLEGFCQQFADKFGGRLALQLFFRPDLLYAPVMHHGDAVCQKEGFKDVVGDENDGFSQLLFEP